MDNIGLKGFVNINKPTGLTSSDVVIKVRNTVSRCIGEKVKAGHLGTLDPGGAGVLPVALGKATRLFDFFLDKDKVYRADFAFGKETDTLDSYGKVTKRDGIIPSENEVIDVMNSFVGKIEQIPPMYSSLSVNGVRAYDLARSGKEVELPTREVEIYSVSFVRKKAENVFTFDIHCSSGTYIRSLVRDTAIRLGTIAYMASIIRLRSGSFGISESITLDELAKDPLSYIIPIDKVLEGVSYIDLPDILGNKAANGVKLDMDFLIGNAISSTVHENGSDGNCSDNFVVKKEGEIIGIGRINSEGILTIPYRLL